MRRYVMWVDGSGYLYQLRPEGVPPRTKYRLPPERWSAYEPFAAATPREAVEKYRAEKAELIEMWNEASRRW